jgi:ABC-type lipoprotein export system ATPase subunit
VQTERDLAKDELATLNAKHSAVVAQNARLIEQLKALEQESLEIQARIRRGIEVERENENITRSVE